MYSELVAKNPVLEPISLMLSPGAYQAAPQPPAAALLSRPHASLWSEQKTTICRRAIRLVALLAAFIVMSYVAQICFAVLSAWRAGTIPDWRVWQVDPLAWPDIRLLAPLVPVLVLELCLVGWQASSIRRLVSLRSESVMTDWAFLLLLVSGLYGLLIMVAGVGLYTRGLEAAAHWRGFEFISGQPLWLAVPALYLGRSFSSYWLHRLQHSRWLWPLHKTHHAAREFTTLNYLRGHPIELAWQTLVQTMLFASLGFSVDAIAWYMVLNTGQQFLTHSNATQLLPLERIGLVTAAGHRIHHGIEPRYHNQNFGELLNIWDRLFGTYLPPTQHLLQIPIGVEDDLQRYNNPSLPMALCMQAVGWLRVVGTGAKLPVAKRWPV